MSRLKLLRVLIPVAVVVAAVVVFVATKSTPAPATSPPNVTTMDFNTLRTGWDSNEPTLTPSKIQSGSFGQIFSTKLKGSIYSEPLVYNGTVVVTTENAYAYGLKSTNGNILWTRHFGKPVPGERDRLWGPQSRHRLYFDSRHRPRDRGRLPDNEAQHRRRRAFQQPLVAPGPFGEDRCRGVRVPRGDSGDAEQQPRSPLQRQLLDATSGTAPPRWRRVHGIRF